MAIWEKSIKDAAVILAELQAIDSGITSATATGTGLTIETETTLTDQQKAEIAAYNYFTMQQN